MFSNYYLHLSTAIRRFSEQDITHLKQLQQSLENIPNMTKKEAQAMTRALSSEFNKAQKAAKKAAEESKKAAKSTSAAYAASSKKAGASFAKLAD